jgi:PadR family transcriptional regulator, regulatory protein PadR
MFTMPLPSECQIDDRDPLLAVEDALAPYRVEIGEWVLRDGFLDRFSRGAFWGVFMSKNCGAGAMARAAPTTSLLQGTLDVLILKVLTLQPMHGLGIARRIEEVTRRTFRVRPGSLFPALQRMEGAGWLTAAWGESENNRRAKFYRLTKPGRRQLKAETDQWAQITTAMARARDCLIRG